MLQKSLNILDKITKNGFEAYIVGGFPRDMYINRPSADVDICTNATPMELKKIFEGSMLPKDNYGSVAVIYKKIRFDITTYRKDIKYENNRQPVEVEYIDNLEDDLLRRDFIINTLCIDRNGEFLDILGAKKDLDNKIIRTPKDPVEKLTEDALRILRAVRFATILDFEIADDLKDAIKECGHLLKKLSYYRKKEELDKIFSSINVEKGINLLIELNLSKYLDFKNLETVKPCSSSLGIWAQLDVIDIYDFSNNEKQSIKTINQFRKKESITSYDLYINGLFLPSIAAEINGIDKSLIAKKYMKLPIKNRKEININGDEICKLLNIKPSLIVRKIIEDVEKKIVDQLLINDKESIVLYIKKNYLNS